MAPGQGSSSGGPGPTPAQPARLHTLQQSSPLLPSWAGVVGIWVRVRVSPGDIGLHVDTGAGLGPGAPRPRVRLLAIACTHGQLLATLCPPGPELAGAVREQGLCAPGPGSWAGQWRVPGQEPIGRPLAAGTGACGEQRVLGCGPDWHGQQGQLPEQRSPPPRACLPPLLDPARAPH